MLKKMFLGTVLLLLVVLVFPAAAQEGEDASVDVGAAFVRVAHFALNTNDVDVYINGSLRSFGRDREFGSVSNWLVVQEGSFEIAVTPAGRSIYIVEPTVLELGRESRTTIAVIGDAISGDVAAQVVEEDYTELSQYYARVTVLHAHPTAGIVDLQNDGAVVLGRMAYPGTLTLTNGGSNDGYTTIDLVAGSYNLTVVPNGQSGPTLIDLSGTELEAGMFYFVIATVDEEGNPAAVVVASDGE